MPRIPVLAAAPLLAGCWAIDNAEILTERLAFAPPVGAPDGWWVEPFPLDPTLETRCPDGRPAVFYAVYPASADRRIDPAAEALPTAIVFHSGAFDFVLSGGVDDPLTAVDEGGQSFRESQDDERRLTLEFASRRVLTSLGLYPNLDASESHAGSLPAALAEKGIASLWPTNCWGDLWHNRSGVAPNSLAADSFPREGRTAAEFTYRHAIEPFPPSNPVELPFDTDPGRIYLVGLGDGSRAVSELLNATGPYAPAAAVLDSVTDDYSRIFEAATPQSAALINGFKRIFPDIDALNAPELMGAGSARAVPVDRQPARFGLVLSENDLVIPEDANACLIAPMLGQPTPDTCAPPGTPPGAEAEPRPVALATSPDVAYDVRIGLSPRHVLSNADVDLAKRVADFLGGDGGALSRP